ncbi:MAG: hypothetical protein ACTH0V_00660 [Microbacteriaceae bacterium]
MTQNFDYGEHNYFPDQAQAPDPAEDQPGVRDEPDHDHRHDPEEHQDRAGENQEDVKRPHAKGKGKPRRRSKPSAASDHRRIARRAITAFEGFRTATDQELAVAAVLLDTTGAKRLDPEHLAITLVAGTGPDAVGRLLTKSIEETSVLERVVGLAALTAEERSRIWRVLVALDAITGSPSPQDPVGTSKRLTEAIGALSESAREVFESAKQLTVG